MLTQGVLLDGRAHHICLGDHHHGGVAQTLELHKHIRGIVVLGRDAAQAEAAQAVAAQAVAAQANDLTHKLNIGCSFKLYRLESAVSCRQMHESECEQHIACYRDTVADQQKCKQYGKLISRPVHIMPSDCGEQLGVKATTGRKWLEL